MKKLFTLFSLAIMATAAAAQTAVPGDITVSVGEQFTFPAPNVGYNITEHKTDGTITSIDVEAPEYSISGTPIGNLKVGSYTIKGLTYDAEKGGYYRDYAKDGITVHFESTTMNGDYPLENGDNNILVTYNAKGEVANIVNTFKMGNMPYQVTTNFTSKAASALPTIVAPEAQGDGKTYDLSGRQVGDDAKGIVISNGKKYIKK